MKTLVAPDLHNAIGWLQAVVHAERPDRLVLTGDIPDCRGESRSVNQRVVAFCGWALTREEDVVWCLGNHDAHYLLAHPHLRCINTRVMSGRQEGNGGWERYTQRLFTANISTLALERARYFHYEQGWWISHAGLRADFAHPVHGFSPEHMIALEREEASKLRRDSDHPWLQIGRARMDESPHPRGGLLWQDWEDEFIPIPGVNQIVGHSHGELPRWKNTPDSKNLCIDTGCRHYAIIEDGVVTVKENPFPVERTAKLLAPEISGVPPGSDYAQFHVTIPPSHYRG